MNTKEYNYTPERWRKAGRLLNEAGTIYPSRLDALKAFRQLWESVFIDTFPSTIVEKGINKDTFPDPLKGARKAVFSITNPRTLEARILTLEDEGWGEFSLSFQHC